MLVPLWRSFVFEMHPCAPWRIVSQSSYVAARCVESRCIAPAIFSDGSASRVRIEVANSAPNSAIASAAGTTAERNDLRVGSAGVDAAPSSIVSPVYDIFASRLSKRVRTPKRAVCPLTGPLPPHTAGSV